jgi:dTDP-4-dehydrorhamnose reductase
MKILVTGAHGLLGTEFVGAVRRGGLDVVACGRGDLDVTDREAARARIQEAAPDWVVHCAAYTAVDRAEAEEAQAFAVNVGGSSNVATAAVEIGARMVYISTDYVFDGEQRVPYLPTDRPRPLSVYGRSKLAGEEAVRLVYGSKGGWGSAPLIVRSGWIYGAGGRGFVAAMLERAEAGTPLKIVNDQWGRPTWARNLAEITLQLMKARVQGIWHVADGGEATWAALAREAFRLRGLTADVEEVSSGSWGAAAARPTYSVLDLAKSESAVGRDMMEWTEALSRCLHGDAA